MERGGKREGERRGRLDAGALGGRVGCRVGGWSTGAGAPLMTRVLSLHNPCPSGANPFGTLTREWVHLTRDRIAVSHACRSARASARASRSGRRCRSRSDPPAALGHGRGAARLCADLRRAHAVRAGTRARRRRRRSVFARGLGLCTVPLRCAPAEGDSADFAWVSWKRASMRLSAPSDHEPRDRDVLDVGGAH